MRAVLGRKYREVSGSGVFWSLSSQVTSLLDLSLASE